jgi:hypothetical protein
LPQQLVSSGFQFGQRVGHKAPPVLSIYIYTENPDNPGLYRKTSISMSRTRGAGIH